MSLCGIDIEVKYLPSNLQLCEWGSGLNFQVGQLMMTCTQNQNLGSAGLMSPGHKLAVNKQRNVILQ